MKAEHTYSRSTLSGDLAVKHVARYGPSVAVTCNNVMWQAGYKGLTRVIMGLLVRARERLFDV